MKPRMYWGALFRLNPPKSLFLATFKKIANYALLAKEINVDTDSEPR